MRRHNPMFHAALEGARFSNSFGILSLEEEQVLLDEAATTSNEVSTDLADAERLIEVSSALEDLAVVADGIEEASPTDIALIETVGDVAVAGTDIQPEEVVPSMESYVGRRIATEGLRETAMTIWRNMQEFLKKIWEKIEKFFYNIFGTIPGLRKRLEDLSKSVEAAYERKQENKNFSVTSGVAALCVDFAPVKDGAALNKAVKDLTEAAKFIYGSNLENQAKLGEKIAEIISDFDPERDLAAQADALAAECGKHVGTRQAPGSSTAPNYEGFKVNAGAQLMGNVRLVTKTFKGETGGILGRLDRIRRAGTELANAREKGGTIPGDFNFTTMPLATAETLIKDLLDLLDEVEEYQRGKASKDIKKAKQKLETASERASKAFEKSKGAEAGTPERAAVEYYKSFLNFNQAYTRWVQQPAVPFASHALTAIRASMVMIQKSLAQYK